MAHKVDAYVFVKCSDGLPEIDNKNPKHYVFVNNVNHHAINIWTEFIDKFPPIITSRVSDWEWLSLQAVSTPAPQEVPPAPANEGLKNISQIGEQC